jgi:DNA polymerase/3'-5' exonuclease PolX
MHEMTNDQLARRLEEVASLLEEQDANPYRVRAYRNAADFIPFRSPLIRAYCCIHPLRTG